MTLGVVIKVDLQLAGDALPAPAHTRTLAGQRGESLRRWNLPERNADQLSVQMLHGSCGAYPPHWYHDDAGSPAQRVDPQTPEESHTHQEGEHEE